MKHYSMYIYDVSVMYNICKCGEIFNEIAVWIGLQLFEWISMGIAIANSLRVIGGENGTVQGGKSNLKNHAPIAKLTMDYLWYINKLNNIHLIFI